MVRPIVIMNDPQTSIPEDHTREILAEHFSSKVYSQVEFKTAFGNFFVDMSWLVEEGRAVGLECDGKDYHKDKFRELCRDALILGTGRLSAIYHVQAFAINRRKMDLLKILCQMEPNSFKPGRADVINSLVSAQDKLMNPPFERRNFNFIYRATPKDPTIQAMNKFAKACQGMVFKDLVERSKTDFEFPSNRNEMRIER